jgi:hypothetical protein
VSQNAQVLAHLQGGKTLTPLEAFSLYGTLALHSRIAQLRSEGHQIECRMVTRDGKRWGEYRIVEEVAA